MPEGAWGGVSDLFGTTDLSAPAFKPRIIVAGKMFCEGSQVAPEIGCSASKAAIAARQKLDKGFRPEMITVGSGPPWAEVFQCRSMFNCPYCGKRHGWADAENGKGPLKDKTSAQNRAIHIYDGVRCSGCGCRYEVRAKGKGGRNLNIYQKDEL